LGGVGDDNIYIKIIALIIIKVGFYLKCITHQESEKLFGGAYNL